MLGYKSLGDEGAFEFRSGTPSWRESCLDGAVVGNRQAAAAEDGGDGWPHCVVVDRSRHRTYPPLQGKLRLAALPANRRQSPEAGDHETL